MVRINQPNEIGSQVQNHPDFTRNFEGGIAFQMDAKARLYSRVASCLLGEPQFYTEGKDDVGALVADIQTVAQTDPKFVLQLAAYTRNELHLRTVCIVLLVEAALTQSCKPFVRHYTPMIIKRADELAEAIAYLQKKVGNLGDKAPKGSVPACLKKGLCDAFNNFNEYDFAKYNRKGMVKLKDVLRLVHPKPKDEGQSELFKKIRDDSLAAPDTWEVVISTKGSTKENWEAIMPKMGYMALLRNLRNFLDKGVDIKPVLEKLGNAEAIKNSKQLPFRFLAAYRELQGNTNPQTSKALDTLEKAIDVSVDNLPKLPGITFISADNSGSMDHALSERSKMKYKDVANTLLCIAHKLCESPITTIFATDHRLVQIPQRNGVLSNAQQVGAIDVGSSTNAYLIMEHLLNTKTKVDRIIILSDMQCYDSSGYDRSLAEQVKRYRATINANVFIYSIDLAGYGTLQIPKDEPRTALVAGWSERILEFISVFETDKKGALDKISTS